MGKLRFAMLSLSLIGMIFLVSAPSSQGDERAAVPPTADLAKAEALIKDIFKAEYAKTKTADRVALAVKLLEQFDESKDDQAARYVLLRESRDAAAKAGDADMAMRALDLMVKTFKVDANELRLATANQVVAGLTTPASALAAVDVFLNALEDAKAVDDWKTALGLVKAADAAAVKSKSATSATAIRAKVKEIEFIKAESEKVKPSFAALKTTPDDPAANLAVGRYLCFARQDWDAGLAHLAKGSDEKLKEAAAKDVKAAGGADKLTAGDAWYDLSAKADAGAKPAMQGRAMHWYSEAVDSQTGLNKTKIEKRIEELKTAVETKGDKGMIWSTIKNAVADKDLKEWEIVGGGFFKETYDEIPKEGAILIGFVYTTVQNGKYPGSVQPIFLTAKGEVKGRSYINNDRNASPVQTVKAKPGYAVGAIYTRGGGGFDAFQPIFMKMSGKGLDTSDKYDGPMIGGTGGGEGTLGGDGNLIVGIHGKTNAKGQMGSISPVSLKVIADTTGPGPKKKKKLKQ